MIMKFYEIFYWLITLFLTDSLHAIDSSGYTSSGRHTSWIKRDSCAAQHCSLQMSSFDKCLASKCQITDSAIDDSPVEVIPFPVAVTRRRQQKASETPIMFCVGADVDWPTIKYCTDLECYVITPAYNGLTATTPRPVAGSQQCVQDQCQGDSSCIVDQCCLNSQLMSRKRRVNDDVSQCIQSYCSGKLFRERILCIVKNCNRSA